MGIALAAVARMRRCTVSLLIEVKGRRLGRVETLRIALVASSFAPYTGGVEQHTAQVAIDLRARGHQVEVWTVARNGVAMIREVEGTTVRYLPAPLPARSIKATAGFIASVPSAAFRWLRAWGSFRPQILHVQCFGPNGLYAHALSKLTHTPLVLSSHGETDADDNGIFQTSRLLPTGLGAAIGSAARVTACSASVAADLRDTYGVEDVLIVPNGVSDLEIGHVDQRRGRVAGVGRLEYNKGFDRLIRAMALVEASDLVLVGDGRQREELQSLAEGLGICDRVHFCGALSSADTRRVMAEAEVVVVPSRKEAFGIVALEAWSVGTPLVATSTCGPAHFVKHMVDGLLVDPADAHALAQMISTVLEDEQLATALSEAGRANVPAYTWVSVVNQYVAVYLEVLGRVGGRNADLAGGSATDS